MDERGALRLIDELVAAAGNDAAVINGLALTVDMLHASTDYPDGVTHYTAGWRSVAVSLSDLAAVGATPTATVTVYSPKRFDQEDLAGFVSGAIEVSRASGAEYVGGDLDTTDELTTVGVALGKVDRPVGRDGARVGDAIVVTGGLGRGAAAVASFDHGDIETGNELFRFVPRVDAGRHLAAAATAMIDSSDGIARSLHQLAEASDCGVAIEFDHVPVDQHLRALVDDPARRRERTLFWGEDFELIATMPEAQVETVRRAVSVPLTRVGRVVDAGVTIDGDQLPDRGYTHGET